MVELKKNGKIRKEIVGGGIVGGCCGDRWWCKLAARWKRKVKSLLDFCFNICHIYAFIHHLYDINTLYALHKNLYNINTSFYTIYTRTVHIYTIDIYIYTISIHIYILFKEYQYITYTLITICTSYIHVYTLFIQYQYIAYTT